MKHLRFTFDVVSPYAYLAFERLPQVLEGLSVSVSYEPVLLAGLLKHWGQKGPAEIAPKRDWIYRQVQWLAQREGVVLQMPAPHPFNPLALLRLALACGPEELTPSRWVCESVLRHVWQGGGADPNAPERLDALTRMLAPRRDPAGPEVKAVLQAATADAAARGVFGVPTIEVDGRLFWGLDGFDMLVAHLRGERGPASGAWEGAGQAPPGPSRKH